MCVKKSDSNSTRQLSFSMARGVVTLETPKISASLSVEYSL
jgi:hypothetical protein